MFAVNVLIVSFTAIISFNVLILLLNVWFYCLCCIVKCLVLFLSIFSNCIFEFLVKVPKRPIIGIMKGLEIYIEWCKN